MRVKRKRSPKHRRRTVQLPLSTTDSPAVVHLPVPLNLPLGVAPHLLLKFGRLSHIASSLWRFRCVCVVLMLGLNLSARRCAPRPSCVASLSRSFFFFGGEFHLGGRGFLSPISFHSSKSQLPNEKISIPPGWCMVVREFKYSRSATAPGAQGERMSMVQQLGALALLNPKNTAVVARGACLLFGLAYPVYRTFKALERRPTTGGRGEEGRTTNPLELWLGGGVEGERSGCLTYWSVYGCISMAEVGVEPIFQVSARGEPKECGTQRNCPPASTRVPPSPLLKPSIVR